MRGIGSFHNSIEYKRGQVCYLRLGRKRSRHSDTEHDIPNKRSRIRKRYKNCGTCLRSHCYITTDGV